MENDENKWIQTPIISSRDSFFFQFQNALEPLRDYIPFRFNPFGEKKFN